MAEAAKHTPGPWEADGPDVVARGRPYLTAIIVDYSRTVAASVGPAEAKANALLFAAALDQNAALATAPRPFTNIDNADALSAFLIGYADWFFKMRGAAIDKADGRS